MAKGQIKQCAECGKDFLQVGEEGFCIVCELQIQAVEAPEVLRDMRHIYAHREPQTPGQQALRAVLMKDPKEFLSQLRRAEAEYRAHLRAHEESRRQKQAAGGEKPSTVQGCTVEEEEDGGRGRVLELLDEEWGKLKEMP